MSITFYSMKGCGFCVKSEKMFASELASGEIVKKDSSEANGKFRGFPTFVNNENGLSHSGLPPSKSELYKKLGFEKENYSSSPKPTFFCGGIVNKPLYIIEVSSSTYYLVGLQTSGNGKPSLPVVKKLTTAKQEKTTCSKGEKLYTTVNDPESSATYVESISAKEIESKIIAELKVYFPCMSSSDWKNLQHIDSSKLKPVSPCNNLPGVFVCDPETDCAKYQKYDHTKYILYIIIAILILVVLFLLMRLKH